MLDGVVVSEYQRYMRPEMTKTQELLQDREIAALRFTTFMRIVFAISVLSGTILFGKTVMEKIVVSAILGVTMVTAVIFLTFLKAKQHLLLVGVVGAVLDAIILTSFPVVWYLSVGGPPISPAYMIKGPFYLVYLVVIAVLQALSLRPLYIGVYAGVGTVGFLAISLYIFLGGRAEVSDDFVAHNLGPGVNPFFVYGTLMIFIGVVTVLLVFTSNIRKTIHAAVRDETTAADLGRYFSPKIRSEIMSEEKQIKLAEGRQQEVVVLFSDIRNFTAFCEEKSPKEVLSFLKTYHQRMVHVIFTHGGTLDKFIGDGILATFGTPDPGEEDAGNAVRAALEMNRALQKLNDERHADGLSAIAHGIGIHCGPVIVGNIGSDERLEYTVIGDTVNVASRLESATKELREEILISRSVHDRCIDVVHSESKGVENITGRREGIEVFTVLGEKNTV